MKGQAAKDRALSNDKIRSLERKDSGSSPGPHLLAVYFEQVT